MSELNCCELDRQVLADYARRWHEAGFAVLPVKTDGTKRPDVPEWARMAKAESTPPSTDSVVASILSGRTDGIGLLMGAASGHAEMLEFEGRAVGRLPELEQHARLVGAFDLLSTLMAGCVERTPAGGLHFYLRVSDGPARGNDVFAKRPPGAHDSKELVLAESRGQGGFSVCAPSGGRTHNTGRPYELVAGGPETVPCFTAEQRDMLHDLFRFLDERPRTVAFEQADDRADPVDHQEDRPGDDFNRRAAWQDILVGWTRVYSTGEGTPAERTHWRRPGKNIGTSATTGGERDWLYVFSTSTELPAEQALSKFAVYAHLHHGGDFRAAAESLSKQGYGTHPAGGVGQVANVEYQPFPLDALPEPLRTFVETAATAAGCDPAYIALPAFAAVAAAIGTTRRLRLKRSWTVPSILWTLAVAESGSQKSVGFRMALAPIEQRQQKAIKHHKQMFTQYEAELAEWEREKSQWKQMKVPAPHPEKPEPPFAERFMVSDTTVEALAVLLQRSDRGLLLARDELKGWIGSFDRYTANGKSKADEAHWLTMYNGGAMLVDRKTGQAGTIFVPSAAISITGGIPPGTLRRVLDIQHRESGLAARLLMAYPPRRIKCWTEATVPEAVEQEYAYLFNRLYALQAEVGSDGESRPVEATLDAEAKEFFTNYFNAHNVEQAELVGDMAALWSKLEETVARLAMVSHYVRWAGGKERGLPRDTIDGTDIAYGILLVEWFKNEAKRIYAMLGETEQEEEARRLIQWLQKRGGSATIREVQQGCRWLRQKGMAEVALVSLLEAGNGQWVPAGDGEAGPKGGRRFVLEGCREKQV